MADAPLLRKEKAVALRQLALLDGIAAQPAWTADAVRVMAAAFGHPRPDVQKDALDLVGCRLEGLPATVVDELRVAADACAPSLAARVLDVFGAGPTTSVVTMPPPEVHLPPPPALPPPLDDDEALVEAAVSTMAARSDSDPLIYERVIEGLLARIDQSPDDLAKALEPAVAAARKSMRAYNFNSTTIAGAVLLTVDQPVSGTMLDATSPVAVEHRHLLERRWYEALARLQRRRNGPWLSMPTDPDGRVDPEVLAERESRLGEIEAHLVVADRAIARGRAGLADPGRHGSDDAVPAPSIDWRAAATYGSDRPLLPTHGIARQVKSDRVRHWPFVWPHWPEHAVAHVSRDLRREVEHEPTAFEPSVTVPLLAWLTQPTVAAGDWTAAALAFGLGSRVALHRAAAVDALLVLVPGERVSVAQVVGCVLAACEAGLVKTSRLAQALGDVVHTAPILARDLALGVLPVLIDRGGRDAHRLLTLAADAVAMAGPVELPATVVEVAGRKGSSKLVSEARRLAALGR